MQLLNLSASKWFFTNNVAIWLQSDTWTDGNVSMFLSASALITHGFQDSVPVCKLLEQNKPCRVLNKQSIKHGSH